LHPNGRPAGTGNASYLAADRHGARSDGIAAVAQPEQDRVPDDGITGLVRPMAAAGNRVNRPEPKATGAG